MSKLSKLPKLDDRPSAAAFDDYDSFDRGGGEAQGGTPNLYVQCHTNPRLGALTRSSGCEKAAAERPADPPGGRISRGNEKERQRSSSTRHR